MTAPHILISPDKFKGSVTAREAAAALGTGVQDQVPDAVVSLLPLADGGDGSVDAALSRPEMFTPITLSVPGPHQETVKATLALSTDHSRAVVEVANTCGLALVPHVDEASARNASSLGFGQALRWALDAVSGGHSAEGEVVAAIGGSSSTDGGAGVLHALGARFYTADGVGFLPTGGTLTQISRVEITEQFSHVLELVRGGKVRLTVASDVTTTLLGPRGAAPVFGPQKGASALVVEELEAGLTHLRHVLSEAGLDAERIAQEPGAGAAGGIGFALMLVGGHLVSGAGYFLDLLGFDEQAAHAHLVITGEGSFDSQTLEGKLPAVVAARAHKANPEVKVAAVAGRIAVDEQAAQAAGFSRLLSLTDIAGRSTAGDHAAAQEALRRAGAMLAARA